MEAILAWRKWFDWICGIILFVYIMGTLFFGIILLVIADYSTAERFGIFAPAIMSIFYFTWRLIEQTRKRIKDKGIY